MSNTLPDLPSPEARIVISTLSTTSVPFEQVSFIHGLARTSIDGTIRTLQARAHDLGCDAVLGVGIAAISAYSFFAYGTGVRWVDSIPDQPQDS